jgi:hypothetical protein
MLIRINSFSTFRDNLQKQNKPVEQWSNKDFLLYFSQRYRLLTGQSFKIPSEAWVGMMHRIKSIKIKLKLNNKDYKEFIDKVFDNFFSRINYAPNFGSIVSEKVFFITTKMKKDINYSNNEFIRLRDELYTNSELFKNLLL